MLRPALFVLTLATPAAALEQLSLLLPNDRSLPMGEIGSIEGSAVVARTNGASAGWYNPAGLAGQAQSEVMGSASIYEYSRVAVDSPIGSDSRSTVSVLPGAAGISEPLPKAFGGNGEWGVGVLVATPVFWRTSVAQQERAPTSTGTVSVSSTYDATYEVYLPTLSLGRAYGDHRIGFTGAVLVHQLSVSSANSLVQLPEGQTASSSVQFHGRTVLVRLGVGWQWQHEGLAMGATVSAPGIPIWRDGDRTDNLLASDVATGVVQTRSGSTSEYPLNLDAPAQTTVAVARTTGDWSCELDLTLGLGSGERELFPSYQITRSQTVGGVTTTQPITVAAVTSQRRTVLNGALGFARRVTDTWWAHAGALSDRSPVSDSELFSKVDLWTVVGGVSVHGEHSVMTAGIATTWNTSGTSSSIDLPTGTEVAADLSIRTWRFIVGSSYRF